MTCCGIDPGSEKFGMAIGSAEELMFSAIIPYEKVDLAVRCVASGDMRGIAEWRVEGDLPPAGAARLVYLGGGTGHRPYLERLTMAKVECIIVDEYKTTLEGRELYWKLHPPALLMRIIPLSLRVPGRPVDDLAAWAILKRGLNSQNRY
jgi:RNase H-fold protein (predicted Holliday junction resolvase)